MQRPVVSELFSLLAKFGVRHVICSPGSRNAVLLMQAEAYPEMRKTVVVDERCAAFVALGIAMVSQSPVALVCTSGSAVFDYAPALAEACYQGIPLIVISADRPYVWIDQDDSQTIRQFGALANIVKAQYDLDGDRGEEDYIWYANRVVNEGLLKALDSKQGPVHFNIHLNGDTAMEVSRNDDSRKIDVITPPSRLSSETVKNLAREAAGKKIMLVAGFMPPDNKVQKAVAMLEELPNVCIMAETISNLHLPNEAYMVDTALFKLSQKDLKALAPDILISIGGALVSRRLKEFLRSNPPARHWSLSCSDNLIDCFRALTLKMECREAPFLQTLAKMMKRLEKGGGKEDSYRNEWLKIRKATIGDPLSRPWSDLLALKMVFDALPQDANLFLSNGTSVRYAQILPYRLTHATYSNRGVSGIDGCTSTAVGGALVYDKLTCLVTGDMSFCYDLGGLGTRLAPPRMRIVVLDNGGGDIFRFISATKNLAIREKYLSARQELSVEALADAFGWEYFYADSPESLNTELEEFFSDTLLPAILHVDTSRSPNAEILTQFLSGEKNP